MAATKVRATLSCMLKLGPCHIDFLNRDQGETTKFAATQVQGLLLVNGDCGHIVTTRSASAYDRHPLRYQHAIDDFDQTGGHPGRLKSVRVHEREARLLNIQPELKKTQNLYFAYTLEI